MFIRLFTTVAIAVGVLSGCAVPPAQVQNNPATTGTTTPASAPTTATTTPAASASPTPAPSAQCRKEPLAGVYNPQRLEVKEACKTVSGTIDSVRHETDGDYHIALKLDKEYADLINDKNVKDEHGDIVVEIIPLDEPKIPTPKKGEHITVTGSYVLDKHHGWMEIHPAWIVDGKGSIDYAQSDADKSAASPSDEDATADSSPSPQANEA